MLSSDLPEFWSSVQAGPSAPSTEHRVSEQAVIGRRYPKALEVEGSYASRLEVRLRCSPITRVGRRTVRRVHLTRKAAEARLLELGLTLPSRLLPPPTAPPQLTLEV